MALGITIATTDGVGKSTLLKFNQLLSVCNNGTQRTSMAKGTAAQTHIILLCATSSVVPVTYTSMSRVVSLTM